MLLKAIVPVTLVNNGKETVFVRSSPVASSPVSIKFPATEANLGNEILPAWFIVNAPEPIRLVTGIWVVAEEVEDM